MKKILYAVLTLVFALATRPAAAVEVGDIYYHDGTFSNTFTTDKGGRTGVLDFGTQGLRAYYGAEPA